MELCILVLTSHAGGKRIFICRFCVFLPFLGKVWVKIGMKTCNIHGGVCFLTAFSSVLCLATFNRD